MFIICGTMGGEGHLGLGLVTSCRTGLRCIISCPSILADLSRFQEEDSFSLGAALTRYAAQTLTFKFGLFLVHLLPVASCVRRFRKSQSKHHALYTVRCWLPGLYVMECKSKMMVTGRLVAAKFTAFDLTSRELRTSLLSGNCFPEPAHNLSACVGPSTVVLVLYYPGDDALEQTT